MMTKEMKIAFIGAGNMGGALIGGLIASGYLSEFILASCPDKNYLLPLQQSYQISVSQSNLDTVAHGDILVLAIKPQILPSVMAEIASMIVQRRPLIISIVAGIEVDTIQSFCGHEKLAIVRAMPNTPALVGASATALYADSGVSEQQKQIAENIFKAIGVTAWLTEEQQMLAVTALFGSGPAYFFLLMQALEKTAVELNVPPDVIHQLLPQTALGAARMVMAQSISIETLLRQVMSPGGGTEKAIHSLEEDQFSVLINKAVKAAEIRYRDLMGK